jgi:competence/damage-inducible protein CinA-like protein
MVVTGTEVLTGRVRDRNGPWVSEQLLELGVELAHVTICGDRPEDIEAQLRFLADQGVDLILTSGGLGPTADDMTVEVVARFAGRELRLDEPLEQRIVDIVRPLMERLGHTDVDAIRAANRKQALIPEGAHVIEPVGTAPGVVVPGSPPVVVLPGPPFELQGMWERALATPPVREALGERPAYEQGMLRLFGIPESAIAETLRIAEPQIEGFERLEITTCLRRGEVEVVTRWEPADAAAYAALEQIVTERHAQHLFSRDGSSVDDQVAALLQGRRIALAESCTGGLLAARLTERPGSSDYVAGGVVAYADEVKVEQLGVDPAVIVAHGAVSEEVARGMAEGVLQRLGADVAVSVTGIAGPGGGSAEKPVGTVCFGLAVRGEETETRGLLLPGDRAAVRDRSTTVAMHLLRRRLSPRPLDA